jgi:hypothetical protein
MVDPKCCGENPHNGWFGQSSAGVAERDVPDVVRVMQWKALGRICYLLSDPCDVESEVKDSD